MHMTDWTRKHTLLASLGAVIIVVGVYFVGTLSIGKVTYVREETAFASTSAKQTSFLSAAEGSGSECPPCRMDIQSPAPSFPVVLQGAADNGGMSRSPKTGQVAKM